MHIVFPNDWDVLPYDLRDERKGKVPQDVFPFAVDFVLLRKSDNATISFLELKGFQDAGSANRHKLSDGSLEKVVANKVRDTIAGIIGFAHTAQNATFRPFAKALGDTAVKFEVNLWIEADLSLLGKREKHNIDWKASKKAEIQKQIEKMRKAKSGPFLQRMKKALSWASSQVQLCHSGNIGSFIPGIAVKPA